MKHRKVRIAWSVGWGIAAAMLVMLWVRSYQSLDNLSGHLPGVSAISCTSAYGRIAFGNQHPTTPRSFNFHSAVLDGKSFGGRPKEPRKWFLFQNNPAATSIQVPHGFFALLSLVAIALPWLPCRFSLSTLLIAITLGAFGLGLIAWLR